MQASDGTSIAQVSTRADIMEGWLLIVGGVTVRASDDINRDIYVISLPSGGPPRIVGRWSEGPTMVAPGHVLVVAPAVYERLIGSRATTRLLPVSGWAVFDPSKAPKKRKRYR